MILNICQQSDRSIFPDHYKIAKLRLLFKKDSKSDRKNYRPITLLPAVPKIIEKTIHIQTQECLDKNGLLYKYQSNFCATFPTDSRLLQLKNFILRGIDKGFHIGMILIDLQKAFDTLDHTVLLRKMDCIGFKESVIKWFQSYLSNITVFLTLQNIFTDGRLKNCGVPQGSILV